MVTKSQTYTIEQYQAFEARHENADRIFELVEGELIEKMPSFKPSQIAIRISYFLSQNAIGHDSGYLTGEAGGYIMSDDTVFIPDVGYISKEHLPTEPDCEVPVPPDLAVEVKSPTDSKRKMRQKAEKYLAFGTRLVWLVFPDEQVVEVYMPDQDVMTVEIDGVLDGADVLPGFNVSVKQIFG